MKQVPRFWGFFLWAVTLPALAGVPETAQCPAPGIPPGSRVTLVAPRSRVDGLPLLILTLHTRMSPAQLLTWYQHRWQGIGKIPKARFYTAGPWAVVARKKAGCFETVQVPLPTTATTPTRAYLGISRPGRMRKASAAAARFPMPGGSQLLLSMEGAQQHHSRNLLFLAPGSPGATVYFYQHTLSHQGWALQMNQHTPTGRALMYQRGDQHVEIALSPEGSRTDVFVTVSHD